jgi:hypothetical protein
MLTKLTIDNCDFAAFSLSPIWDDEGPPTGKPLCFSEGFFSPKA